MPLNLYNDLFGGMELSDDVKVSNEFMKTIDAFYDNFMKDSKSELYPSLMPDRLKEEFESNISQIREFVCETFFKATDRDNFTELLTDKYMEWANGRKQLTEIMLCVSALANHIYRQWRFIKKDSRAKRTVEIDNEQSAKRVKMEESVSNELNMVSTSTVDNVNILPDNVLAFVVNTQTSVSRSALPTDPRRRLVQKTVSATQANITNGPSKQLPPADPRRKSNPIPPTHPQTRLPNSDAASTVSASRSGPITSVPYYVSNDGLVSVITTVTEKSNNFVNGNIRQESSTNIPENEENDDQQHENSRRRRVNFSVEPIVHEVAAHISEDFLKSGHERTPKDKPTKNYREIEFDDISGFERKVDIGQQVTGIANVSVPYSFILVPLPKTCEYGDWGKHSNGLKSKTCENFIEILNFFNCSQTKTVEGRLTRLFIHDTLLYPANITLNLRCCEALDIGFPTSFDVYFEALEVLRKQKKNGYIMDRIYISIGCDLVMRAFNDKDCLNDVKHFFGKFFKELKEDFGPNSIPRYRSQGAFGIIAPKYPIVYIINIPIWKFKRPNIMNFNRRFEILNNYLKNYVQEKKSIYAGLGLVVELIDWNTLAKEKLAESGIGSSIEDKDAQICLDMRYATLNEYLLSIGEMKKL